MNPVIAPMQAAEIRTSVTVPLRFADGFEATASVSTFRHLVDDAEHLLLSFGGNAAPAGDAAAPRCGCTASA